MEVSNKKNWQVEISIFLSLVMTPKPALFQSGEESNCCWNEEEVLYRDRLFIIPQIETSLVCANLPHNGNRKMDHAVTASKSLWLTMDRRNQICTPPLAVTSLFCSSSILPHPVLPPLFVPSPYLVNTLLGERVLRRQD